MSEQVSLPHSEAWNLIPWHVNGSLQPQEAAAFSAHLERCAECQAEVDACSRLQVEVRRGENVAPAPHPSGLQRLWDRIDAESIETADDGDRNGSSGRLRRAIPGAAWRWVVAAQWLAILVLGGFLLSNTLSDEPQLAGTESSNAESAAQFRTLSDPEGRSGQGEAGEAGDRASAQRIRIVFAPPTTEQEIRQALLDVRAEIVGGPSPMGAYTIAIDSGRAVSDPPERLVEWLRQQPSVLFAEALAPSVAKQDAP